MPRKWISKAIKHEGSLTEWAKKHHFMGRSGKIKTQRAYAYAKRHGLTHRMRQLNLVKNVKRTSAKGGRRFHKN
jgi:hypothetical protein